MQLKNDDPEVLKKRNAQRREKIALTVLVTLITLIIIGMMLLHQLNAAVHAVYPESE